MEIISDTTIFTALANVRTGSAAVEPSLPEAVRQHLQRHLAGLTVATAATGLEVKVTGPNLPVWIKPLHFEENLNAAIDALEAVEALLGEHRQLIQLEIQHRYFGRNLNGQERAEHEARVAALALPEYRQNLLLRLAKRMTDLLEYGKAAKLGAKLLFNVPIDLIELGTGNFGPGQLGINQLREGLRALLTYYRQLAKEEQELVLPLSLKGTRTLKGEYLVDRWGDKSADRAPLTGLAVDVLAIDLRAGTGWFDGLTDPRLRRIGVQVIDRTAGIASPAGTESSQALNFWRLGISEADGGRPLGYDGGVDLDGKPVAKLEPADVVLDVPGARDPFAITWSRVDSLLNFPPDRRWRIWVGPVSHCGTGRGEIRDIVLHFHIVHQGPRP